MAVGPVPMTSTPSPDASPNSRKTLVTIIAVAVSGVLIVISSLLASDSVSGAARPTTLTAFLRILSLTLTLGAYAGVLFFYSKKNAAFRERLEAAANTPLPTSQKKKKKKK